MTPLARALSREFDKTTRERGYAYFEGGHVRIESASESQVTATVRGTLHYHVECRRYDGEVRSSCTCPRSQTDNCKHVWAVILAADEARVLQGDGDNRDAWLGYDPIDDPVELNGAERSTTSTAAAPRQGTPTTTDWRKQLARLDAGATDYRPYEREAWPSNRELLYVIDVAGALQGHGLCVQVLYRDPKKDGTWRKPKSRTLPRAIVDRLPNPDDRYILTFLAGATQIYSDYGYGAAHYGYETSLPARYRLVDPQPELLLPALCKTGRCRLRLRPEHDVNDWLAVTWDDAEPWQFRLEVRRSERDERYEVRGALRRGNEWMDLAAPLLLVDAGVVFTRDRAARLEHHGAFKWIALLRSQPSLSVPVSQADDFLVELFGRSAVPPLDLPEELRYEEIAGAPRPRLAVKPAKDAWQPDRLRGELSFDYGGTVVARGKSSRGIVQAAQRRVLLRDLDAESAAEERLRELGWRLSAYSTAAEAPLELAANRLPRVVRELIAEGWHVEAEGKLYRSPGRFELRVGSGIDWFELHGTVEFDGEVAHLPALLEALRRGEAAVRLGDGSFGLLPEEWLKRYGLIAEIGSVQEDHVRFASNQIGVLDALLAAQPEIRCDELFAQARAELERFSGVQAAQPPAGFVGELRPYQQEGVGWLGFLRDFGFGGCLADDMGLGKTVQILALLEARRELRERSRSANGSTRRAARALAVPSGPSLVVVPKSLIFNWRQEAARFAPRLRVLDYTGPLRRRGRERFGDYDAVLTTYGTLRNDVVDLKDVRFDYVILDEAQAIKNADSASAKAARLLQADHRLALSGTPVENHIGELWSLVEFLNPGMLGAASIFRTARDAANALDDETRAVLARALRPFILRRTKEQVMRDLPPKIEQTLYCELDGKQRKLYEELRDHYRGSLLKRIARDGIARAKIQVLEALLRLRQAAIHPGLLDERRAQEPSAKLEMLLHRLDEVVDEGHKALVFSQFTSMLGILRAELDRRGVQYEYLDGQTRNREARVARFQSDTDCKVFLISLKAGGLGLNLTAAQYVFLLDPWWNPAVEAQAVDRAHRIGQTNQVFAYRLIARGTIEDKILELQNAKRDLADAIVGAGDGLIRRLTKEDLELLLA
jgi:superfamily II DNA or RNA helicase